MAEQIKMEEWLAELTAISAKNPDGFTTSEVADRLERSVSWVRQMLRKAVDEGLVVMVGRRSSRRIDGVPCFTPVYRSVKKGSR